MIRILLSLAIAAAAFLGPWLLNSEGVFPQVSSDQVIDGKYFAEGAVNCALELDFSLTGQCEPEGEFLGKMVTITIIAGIASAVLNIAGLLPFVGRLTSLVTIAAGGAAIATFILFGEKVIGVDAASLVQFRWGAYATAAFGLLAVLAGLAGVQGADND